MRRFSAAAVALWAGMAATTAQAAAEPPCLTRPEAAAFFTAIMPDLLDGLGKKCAPYLPADAALRAGLPPLIERYRQPAEAAWPQALIAFKKIGGKDMEGVDPKLMRPLIGPIMGALISDDIKPADCPDTDRIAYLLAPLPPANTAELVAILIEMGTKKDKNPPLRICPMTGRQVAMAPPRQ